MSSSSGCGLVGCGQTSATWLPSTMRLPPSTGPSGSRERRSSAFIREDSGIASAVDRPAAHAEEAPHRLDTLAGRLTAPAVAVNAMSTTSQAGIFALGTASHVYLELDLEPGARGADLVKAVSGLREPRTTIGGVNLVAGFRPELWRALVPDGLPPGVTGFTTPITGAGGFIMPATQHDAVLWISGSAYDVVFDVARRSIAALRGACVVAEETSS